MNQKILIVAIISLLLGGVAGARFITTDDAELVDSTTPIAADFLSLRPELSNLPDESLSEAEQSGLLYMREEEKLARDVYQALYEMWELPIFTNIAQSEQTHTESVRQLLEKYNIPDPVADDTIGVFVNPDLAALYGELVATGEQSLVDALRVGATVEDLDIFDLQSRLAETDNQDIKLVYENLMRGSRNHLRAFTRQLESRDASYEATYITPEEYEAIVTSPTEAGSDQGRSAGRGWGGR